MSTLKDKVQFLQNRLMRLDDTAIAFSGGVDSALLLAAAKKMIKSRVVAVTLSSPSMPMQEEEAACRLAAQMGAAHVVLSTPEFDDERFVANVKERCYFCKKVKFAVLANWCQESGYQWIVEGTNADDAGDWRPGMKALREFGNILSPLQEARFTKREIRALAKEWHIPVWNKPSSACLVSRLPYGIRITVDELKMIEQAENIVKKYFGDGVRVRSHGNLARLEVAVDDIGKLAQNKVRTNIIAELKKIGYTYITVDLEGYRTGSMNDQIRGKNG